MVNCQCDYGYTGLRRPLLRKQGQCHAIGPTRESDRNARWRCRPDQRVQAMTKMGVKVASLLHGRHRFSRSMAATRTCHLHCMVMRASSAFTAVREAVSAYFSMTLFSTTQASFLRRTCDSDIASL